ncbi:hypothetical protein FRB90_001957 [Tulasnella sp. 427]|nr:hypothetical protein FRB90_001957 [Tulasnella sp. 427]
MTLAVGIEEEESFEEVLACNDEEVADLDRHLGSNFMRRLWNALQAKEHEKTIKARPACYKLTSTVARSTITSCQQKIAKETTHLRENGYHDIQSFWGPLTQQQSDLASEETTPEISDDILEIERGRDMSPAIPVNAMDEDFQIEPSNAEVLAAETCCDLEMEIEELSISNLDQG